MAHYMYDYYMLKRSGRYFGYINYETSPTLFAFRKQKNIETIRDNICSYKKYKINDHISDVYKITYEQPLDIKRKTKISTYEIERMGYFDMNLHITLNNVKVHIIDDIIEDDDTNIYLVNSGTVMDPVYVNDNMVKRHLNKFINTEKVNEDT
jgi:hypothetical protein